MVTDATLRPLAALRAPQRVTRGFGTGTRVRVLIDLSDAIEPCIEGMALADEVQAHVERVLLAAAAGSRQAVVNEAGRLGYRAAQYRREFARMVAGIEPPDDGSVA